MTGSLMVTSARLTVISPAAPFLGREMKAGVRPNGGTWVDFTFSSLQASHPR
jgi:hypothetical protein